jgi:hypothetical protein
MVDWVCSATCFTTNHPKLIQGAVEWHEEKRIQRPDWCPIVQEIRKEIEDLNSPIFLCEGI